MALNIVTKIVLSLVVVIVILFISKLVRTAIKRQTLKNRLKKRDGVLINKVLRWSSLVVALVVLILIWGFSIENFWLTITGIIGVVAIGFFATWSLLSNIVSGLFVLWSKHTNVDDKIELLPEGIEGRIKDITLMNVFIEDERGNLIQIPNNLFIQKIVKIYKK